MSNDETLNTLYLVALQLLFIFAVIGATLLGCAPTGYTVKAQPAVSQPLPTTTVYFYPTRGQSEQQQDRDRYECYMWAVKQTGFDPGQAQLAPHQRIEVT
ncbi:MAG: hypothetical protein L0Z73_11675 [Gammaproteobacteria bacterium]|nr:hypothetical protein [Gammaproteobacteria bacterium]